MLDKETIIRVTNRSNGSVGYSIPDLGNLTRRFESGETKELTMEELRKLSYQVGGMPILRDYLVMDNEEAIEELLSEVEPEYFYTENEIRELLERGTLAQFEDCLDFAPDGTIELLEKMAVDMELNDLSKRKLILEKTGFDVTSAISINYMDKEDSVEKEEAPKKRRASAISTNKPEPAGRKSTPVGGKYKVTKIGK